MAIRICVWVLAAVMALSTARSVLALNPAERAAIAQPAAGAVGGNALLTLSTPPTVAVQVMPQGYQTYGTFGYRTLGQSFVPSLSTFGGGIQTGPGGNFLSVGRSAGSAMFGTPLGQAGQQGAGGTPAAQPALNPGLVPGTIRQENMGAAEEGLEMPTGLEPPTASAADVRQYGMGGTSPAAPGMQPYAHSLRLSDLLTRIARSKGIMDSKAIDVYLSNNVALVQGAVHTPQDRVLLANVLALEPEVSLIDNRLVVEGSGTPASK